MHLRQCKLGCTQSVPNRQCLGWGAHHRMAESECTSHVVSLGRVHLTGDV